MGRIEIGHIWFAPPLQRTRGATEAIYLMCRHVFDDLGYRRLEWKCDALNERLAARGAALRLHATRASFRQHMVVKGRNRDTAWYSIARSRMAGGARRVRALAGARQLRRSGPAADLAQRTHRDAFSS